jgi:hypothetical protein
MAIDGCVHEAMHGIEDEPAPSEPAQAGWNYATVRPMRTLTSQHHGGILHLLDAAVPPMPSVIAKHHARCLACVPMTNC